MADNEIVHVAIDLPTTQAAHLVKKMAAVINKAPYDTRLLLAGEIPRIIFFAFWLYYLTFRLLA